MYVCKGKTCADTGVIPVVRVLAQVLVNATTDNPKVQQALWRQHIVTPNGAASRQPSADAVVYVRTP